MKIIPRNKTHYEIFCEIIRKFLKGDWFLTEQYFRAPESRYLELENEDGSVSISFTIIQSLRMIEFEKMGDLISPWKMQDFNKFTIKQIYDFIYENIS